MRIERTIEEAVAHPLGTGENWMIHPVHILTPGTCNALSCLDAWMSLPVTGEFQFPILVPERSDCTPSYERLTKKNGVHFSHAAADLLASAARVARQGPRRFKVMDWSTKCFTTSDEIEAETQGPVLHTIPGASKERVCSVEFTKKSGDVLKRLSVYRRELKEGLTLVSDTYALSSSKTSQSTWVYPDGSSKIHSNCFQLEFLSPSAAAMAWLRLGIREPIKSADDALDLIVSRVVEDAPYETLTRRPAAGWAEKEIRTNDYLLRVGIKVEGHSSLILGFFIYVDQSEEAAMPLRLMKPLHGLESFLRKYFPSTHPLP